MKIIEKRLLKLEDQFGRADGKPRRRLRMLVSMAGAKGFQDRNSQERTRLASPATVPIGSELYRSRAEGIPQQNGSAVLIATQLKLWFARRREDGFEVPCAPEQPPTRVLC
jgi:hypothetical protein